MRRKGILDPKQTYLQIALNKTMSDAAEVIRLLPISDRIIIEAGTPFIKRYGMDGIRHLRRVWAAHAFQENSKEEALRIFRASQTLGGIMMPFFGVSPSKPGLEKRSGGSSLSPYIVADMKTIDRGDTEVAMAADAGASAVIAMGSAPIETLNAFIAACHAHHVDAMIDMMNVEFPVSVLRALKSPPNVVILHRGVDEERDNKQKMLPLHEIRRVKGAFDVMVAVAGGDTPRDVQSAVFNDANIVVVWKSVYERNEKTFELVEGFLKTIK
jgi:bifunctional enzyme Fae/Hps